MRGAISKINGRLNYPGQINAKVPYVNYRACASSITKHIIAANPDCTFDFFLQSWNPELKDELLSLYQPKAHLFEDNDNYQSEILQKLADSNRGIENFGTVSQTLAIQKSIHLLLNYMQVQECTYDLVIIYRYDLLLWKDMILDRYDPEQIYVNAHPNFGGDFHFIMNPKLCAEFSKIYDIMGHVNLVTIHPSNGLYNIYVRNIMCRPLIMDDIVPGRDQEVVRKIKVFSIGRGHLSIEKCLDYGLTKDEIDTYTSM
jgi:hypothetical protein